MTNGCKPIKNDNESVSKSTEEQKQEVDSSLPKKKKLMTILCYKCKETKARYKYRNDACCRYLISILSHH